jgi:hypothetical protein
MTEIQKGITKVTAILFFLFIVSTAEAQKIEISPFAGYETGARTYTSAGYLRIGGGLDYGASVDVGLGHGLYGEFSFSHLGTHLDLEGSTDLERICDLAVDYYSLGAMKEFRTDEKTTPYGLLTLGIVNYRPISSTISSENKMHVSMAFGMRIRASEKFSFRLQSRLMLPYFLAGSYFEGDNDDESYGVKSGFRAVQADFTAALVYAIK